MKLFFAYLKSRRRVMAALFVAAAVFAAAFYLYHLPLEAVAYPVLLCAFFGAIALCVDFRRVRARHIHLLEAVRQAGTLETELPEADSIEEADYRALVAALRRAMTDSADQAAARYRDTIDYYTVWAHQIKTPIAAIRLALQNEDTPLSRRLTGEVGRVEQYVQMALTYLRLGSDSSDYVIRSCALDDIVRPAVRRFAGEFIQRKIQLNYQMLNYTVITDEKWLGFVVEQVLSNALKYTPQGSVSIYMEPEGVLCIRDTGIGIAPEDLPRVFEKGYTGYNGRSHRKASGLGLYLCREILTRLGHSVSAESQVDHGTTIRIDLRQHKTIQE